MSAVLLLLAACAGSNGDIAVRDDAAAPAPTDAGADSSGDLPLIAGVPTDAMPDSPSDGPVFVSPVLSLDNHDVAFRDVIRFLNEEPFTRLTELAPSASTSGVEWVSDTDGVPREALPRFRVPPLPGSPDEAPFPGPIVQGNFRCTPSGALTIYRSSGNYGSVFAPSGCRARDVVYDGLLFTRLAPGLPLYRTTSVNELSAVSLDGAVSGRLESGIFEVEFTSDEPVVLIEPRSAARRVSDVVYEGTADDVPTRVDDYTLFIDYDAPSGRRESGRRTVGVLPDGSEIPLRFQDTTLTLESRFEITSDWTGGQPARVQVELGFSDAYWAYDGWYSGVTSETLGLVDRDGSPLELDFERDDFFHWKTGEIRIEAADGSALSLVPRDALTFLIRADDGETVRRQRASDYEIHCTPYAARYLTLDCSLSGHLANPF